MKILKKGKAKPEWPKKSMCDECGTEVEVDEKDVRDARDRPHEEMCWMTECPECGNMMYFY